MLSMKRFRLKSLWKAMSAAGQAGGPPAAVGTAAASTVGDYHPSGSHQYSPSSASGSRAEHTDLPLSVITSLPHGSSMVPVVARGTDSHQHHVSDVDKTGATLLFSGIFLGLVGMTFTAMGWINYDVSHTFEWTQLLGPILLSVGGTFVLISICKFRMLSCQACKHQEDGGGGGGGGGPDDTPELPHGQSFVFTGINQPITFHRATVVQYIPPPYASVTGDLPVREAQAQAAQLSVNSPPQYYSVCQLEVPPAPVLGTDSMAPCVPSSRRASRIPAVLQEEEEEKTDTNEEDDLDCVFPPAYEDLFPAMPSPNNI